MAEKPREVRSVFRREKALIDKDPWDRLWKKEKERIDIHPELLDLIKRRGGGRVLEIGFGSGGDLRQLADLNYNCTGVEKSREAIRKGKKVLPKKVRLVWSRGEKLPFADGEFETVFHQGVMEHYRDPRRFLWEQRRVLTKNGILIVDVPQKWNLYSLYRRCLSKAGKWYAGWERSYSEGELKKTLYGAGFEVLEIRYRGVWPHRLGKLMYPEKIVRRKWVTKILGTFPLPLVSDVLRWLYENVHLIEVLFSYNVAAVARRRRIKVAIDGRFAEDPGGVGRYIREVIRRIPDSEFWIMLITTKKLRERESGWWLRSIDKVVEPEKLHWPVWEQVQLPILLGKLGPDIYHAAGNWGVPVFCPCPIVLTIHDTIPVEMPGYFDRSRLPWLSGRLYFLRVQIGLWKAGMIMTVSRWSRDRLVKNFVVRGKKVRVVPSGVSRDFFNKRRADDEQVIKMCSVSIPYIICHGGIAGRKNLERLIKAFAMLIKTRVEGPDLKNNLKLVISGEGEGKERLKKEAEALGVGGRVVFPGRVTDKDLVVLVRNACEVVYPTLAEGFGMPLLEGMAAGIPVVASRLEVFREIGGSTPVYVVDPYDEEDIVRGMEKGLGLGGSRDPEINARVAKGKKVAAEFTWEKTVQEVVRSYSEVLGVGGVPAERD